VDEVLSARAYMCFVSLACTFDKMVLMGSMRGVEMSCTTCLDWYSNKES
jgi:hypothetical protein